MKKNLYSELKKKQEKDLNSFPMMFAFSGEQFKEGLKRLNVEATELISIGAGGYIRKVDQEGFENLFSNMWEELKEEIAKDTTGEGFIFDMFDYELGNHEYGYTHDDSDTLRCLGLDDEDIENNPLLKHGLKLAKIKQLEWYRING